MLDPAGPFAAPVAHLSWGLFLMAAVVFAVVIVALAVALFGPERWRSRLRGERAVLGGGLAFPLVVLTVLLVWGLSLTAGLTRPAEDPLKVRLTGHQWWWRVDYLSGPAAGVSEANEIHIPVGRPVTVELLSQDVIHSFWVPQLSGKLDMIPGRRNRLRIQADAPGVYRGQCAEYCGGAHALMALVVVARPEAEHRVWAAARVRPAAEPAEPEARRGRDLFQQQGCPLCHAVRGTPAGGQAGPDLTHVASRRSLAAGVLPNERGSYGAWIAGNQRIKPQNRMPEYRLTPDELTALTAYLEGLT
ncbi:cytochrome c oxidase subunit II [Phenylobacterium sp.]|uniref:cytochrome c oxidase subunit II n=1 Tax=Phenylobacterium sp. TaxID=1871053 RepID=UPI0035AF1465